MKKEKKINQTKKILWIEDEHYHLRGLFKKIKKRGFVVIPARSYIEARNLLKNWSEFCFIALDLIIPYSENSLNNPNLENEETNVDLTKNGVLLFNHIVEELKLDLPILILSIVRSRKIVNSLTKRKFVRSIEKLGKLPADIEFIVLDMLKYEKHKD